MSVEYVRSILTPLSLRWRSCKMVDLFFAPFKKKKSKNYMSQEESKGSNNFYRPITQVKMNKQKEEEAEEE